MRKMVAGWRAMGNTTNSFLRDGAYVTDPVLVDSGAVYTPGISERRGTKTTYLHSGLKNAFAQSDTSQSVAATREYDAFGNVTSHTGAWEGPFGYAGKFGYQSASIPGTSTPDSNLQLLGHRYYDPSTGRFLTRDPIFDGRNWYSYGGGEANPLTQADPTGLRPLSQSEYNKVLAAIAYLAGTGQLQAAIQLEKLLKDGKVHMADEKDPGFYAKVGNGQIWLNADLFPEANPGVRPDVAEASAELDEVTLASILLHEWVHLGQHIHSFNTNQVEQEAYDKQIKWLEHVLKNDPHLSKLGQKYVSGWLDVVKDIAKDYGWKP